MLSGQHDIAIVGGCGRVGLPLALAFADAGRRVAVYDVDVDRVAAVRGGRMPFREPGADALLARLLPSGRLTVSDCPEILRAAETVVLVVGTPVDEFMNPALGRLDETLDALLPHLPDHGLLVLRSTVCPGTTEHVERRLRVMGKPMDVAYCPERITEGHALEELRRLPQLVGAGGEGAHRRASALFECLDVEIIRTSPVESELAKLFSNAWRYVRFALANQFFQVAHSAGADYDRVLFALRHDYPRAADLPDPGFAAGPCLLKDTMQLAACCADHFALGRAAMLVNEGLPGYLVEALDRTRGVRGRTVAILGMAFKGDSDDARASLSYKLKKLLAFRGANVLTTDPLVDDPDLRPLDEVMRQAEILVIGAPHAVYRTLDFTGRDLVDIWAMGGALRVPVAQ